MKNVKAFFLSVSIGCRSLRVKYSCNLFKYEKKNGLQSSDRISHNRDFECIQFINPIKNPNLKCDDSYLITAQNSLLMQMNGRLSIIFWPVIANPKQTAIIHFNISFEISHYLFHFIHFKQKTEYIISNTGKETWRIWEINWIDVCWHLFDGWAFFYIICLSSRKYCKFRKSHENVSLCPANNSRGDKKERKKKKRVKVFAASIIVHRLGILIFSLELFIWGERNDVARLW